MLRIIIIVCMIFMLGSCTQQDAEFIGWMSGYMLGTPVAVDGSGTSLKLIVRFAEVPLPSTATGVPSI